jgi:uncharacterized Tic20 family protein
MAFLAHLLQVFFGFVGPLVIFAVKQDSRFVRFHALQALVWQLCYMGLFFVCIVVFVFGMILPIAHLTEATHSQGPPPVIFVFMPLIWVMAMGGWIGNVILGILYGIKANQGEWAAYPIIGKWFLPKDA